MIGQWITNLTPKRIIIYLGMITVTIYVVWYVIDALDGFDHNFKHGKTNWYESAEKESFGNFDPTKKQSTRLSTTLSAICDFNSAQRKVSCNASRTSDKSTLNWNEDHGESVSGQEKFKFLISHSSKSEILVTLEKCISTPCKEVETTVNISHRTN